MRIRLRDTGAVVYEDEFRALYANTSFPLVLTPELLADFNADPVLEGPQPTLTESQHSVYNGVTQDTDGHWITQYVAVDYTAEELAQQLVTKRETMVVTPFQAKAALHNAGLLDAVTALINDPTTDPLVVLAWNNVTEFRRTSAMIVSLAAKLNLSDTQLDDLFTAAAKITA